MPVAWRNDRCRRARVTKESVARIYEGFCKEDMKMNGIFGTVLVLIILLAMVAGAIYSMIRDRKAGKSIICGGSCGSCAGCAAHGGVHTSVGSTGAPGDGAVVSQGGSYAFTGSSGAVVSHGSVRASATSIVTAQSGAAGSHGSACASCSSSCAYYSRCPKSGMSS